MKAFICLFIAALAISCSTKSKIATKPGSILLNSPDKVESCKFLGVVETKNIDQWEEDLKKTAALMGATHINSKGPNYVGFNEIVSGYAYKCD